MRNGVVRMRFWIPLAAGVVLVAPVARAQIVAGPRASSLSTPRLGRTTVPVVVDAVNAADTIGAVTARLSWRPGVLRLVGTTPGSAAAPAINLDSANGLLRFALASPSGISGSTTVLLATFEAIGVAGDTSSLVLALDEVTRARTFADLLPQALGTTARMCISTGRWGDLNGNDSLNAFDALLIISEAIGLPITPFTSVNGDIDGNGQLDSRDALIVLTYAVGLPTPGFRVATVNTGSCTVRAVASLTITASAGTLAPGDRLTAVAQARDSVGLVVNSAPVAWAAADTAVAVVDAAGNIFGIAPGTTTVYAAALPGIQDSVVVTVGGVRHSWYVDPARAAINGSQTGSALLPFGTFAQAVAAAATNDTVRVAPQLYTEPLVVTRPLVVIGDSGAAGFPRLAPSGVAITVDSVASGVVRIERLAVTGGSIGVSVGSVPEVWLRRLRISGVSSDGIRSRGTGLLVVDSTVVTGVPGLGFTADSTRSIGLLNDSIVGAQGGKGIRIVWADTVRLDTSVVSHIASAGNSDDAALLLELSPSADVRTHGLQLRSSTVAAIRQRGSAQTLIRDLLVDHAEASGPTIVAGQVATLVGEALRFEEVGTLLLDGPRVISRSALALVIGSAGALAGSATVLSPQFDSTALAGTRLQSLVVRGGSIVAGPMNGIVADSVQTVHLSGTSVTDVAGTAADEVGVVVVGVDSAVTDSLQFHGNTFGAIYAHRIRAFSARGVVASSNIVGGGGISRSVLRLRDIQRARVVAADLDEARPLGGPGWLIAGERSIGVPPMDVSLDSNTLRGRGTMINVTDLEPKTAASPIVSVVRVRENNFSPSVATGASGMTLAADSAFAERNVMTGIIVGIQVSGKYGNVQLNDVDCRGSVSGSGVNTGEVASLQIRNNITRGCRGLGIGVSVGVGSLSPTGFATLEIRDNVVLSDTGLSGNAGISIGGRVNGRVAGNQVIGGVWTFGAVRLQALFAGSPQQGANGITIDSNVIRDGIGTGIAVGNFGNERHDVSMRGNTILRMSRHPSSTFIGAILLFFTAANVQPRLVDNLIQANGQAGIVASLLPPSGLRLDSNVVVDNRGDGLVMLGNNVTGRHNVLSRNAAGILTGSAVSGVALDTSEILANTVYGVIASTIALQNNYWGGSAPVGAAQAGIWTTETSLPVAATRMRGAAARGKVFVTRSTVQLWSLDPGTHVWDSLLVPTPESVNVGLAALGDSVFVIGHSTLSVYDVLAGTWSLRAGPGDLGPLAPTAVALGGKIYALGTAGFSVYDPGTNLWTPLTPPIAAVVGIQAMAAANGRVFVIGGGTSQFYDVTTAAWSQTSPVPRARHAPSAAVVNDWIVVLGGAATFAAGQSGQQTVDALSATTRSWSVTPVVNMPAPGRSGMTVVALGDTLYAIGGETSFLGAPVATVHVVTGLAQLDTFPLNYVRGTAVTSPFLTSRPASIPVPPAPIVPPAVRSQP